MFLSQCIITKLTSTVTWTRILKRYQNMPRKKINSNVHRDFFGLTSTLLCPPSPPWKSASHFLFSPLAPFAWNQSLLVWCNLQTLGHGTDNQWISWARVTRTDPCIIHTVCMTRGCCYRAGKALSLQSSFMVNNYWNTVEHDQKKSEFCGIQWCIWSL